MQGRTSAWLAQPLVSTTDAARTRPARFALLLVWLALAAWLTWTHVPWRDEARAWSLMQLGQSWPDMFRAVHGEGHPYLWYIILRAGWDLFGVKQVLPVAGFLIGTAAAALLILRAPFRLGAIALIVFGVWLGFEYVAVARNYGMAVLVMFAIAALWRRIRDSLWLGLLLLALCNTNVPSVFLAGAILLYRTLELWGEQRPQISPEWRRWLCNALLALVGVILCFIAVYPPVNDAASSTQAQPLTLTNLLLAIFTGDRSFILIGFGDLNLLAQLYVFGSLLVFARRPAALTAALAGLIALKLFFFFVYPGFYRHSALFFGFMVALLWIEADKGRWLKSAATTPLVRVGSWAFVILLGAQCLMYVTQPVAMTLKGIPYSNAANLAAVLNRPEYRGSQLMIDPDTYGEAVVYQTGRPFWLIRQDRPGTLMPLVNSNKPPLTLPHLLAQAEAVRQKTGRPVIIALGLRLDNVQSGTFPMVYASNTTQLTPADVADFKARTRKLAAMSQAQGDETYDVYVYPR